MKITESAGQLIDRLQYPTGKVRIILDTDTFNEIDDQFALTYALLSPEQIDVLAITAAPFHNHLSTGPKDGMEKSYSEILRLLARLGLSHEELVYKGSECYLSDRIHPVPSDAASRIVELALEATPEEPIYVVAIGAITNVASAILLEPKITEHIVVVWLGGHALHWPDTREFNLRQDGEAARLVLDCGVPVVLIPCQGVASHLITTLPEIERYVKGHGEIGDYLYQVYRNCNRDHFAYSRVIWDISTIAYLINSDWVPTDVIHSPIITDECTWSFDNDRHFIRCANFVDRDKVFRDLFTKISRNSAGA
ncbi:nucleoside hydrolase [Alicyclobacillus fastidiosus]|uniref:Nucleoside hydrolase n=1 Tax=Alicyclobacillus fastidiosus TaxID=392011 RepID=A0ABV5AGE9_9BACL|nr:nucleoside hydrolase [Alicyclobacillus fastidiosus]WEH09551.1 nucleoside hydrolase [Alicyclobacillus fastidiosus]